MLNTWNIFEDFVMNRKWTAFVTFEHFNASLLIRKYELIYFKNIFWNILCVCINQNGYTVLPCYSVNIHLSTEEYMVRVTIRVWLSNYV